VADRLVLTNAVGQEELDALYRSCAAFAFPSLYEGFGLPILEAFLCGTPVITSDASSTGEVAGDAALLVDPYDTPALRDAIRALSAPDSGPLRAAMAERGRRRAAAFNEAPVAEHLEACYRAILAS
jgi:glycosyltransferase involved in cell wall biosynthesis